MANGSDIQVGDYVIHLTRSDEGLWRVAEADDRALVLESPGGERRPVNRAFAHHLVRQDPERFEVQAAFERGALLREAQEDPARLVTRLARQYGTVSVRDVREKLEPFFASKDAFRKWWAARTTKAALAAAPHLEPVPPSSYRYLEIPREVPAGETPPPAPSAPAVEAVHWPDLPDLIESGDGVAANRIKWRHATALHRALRAGRAAEWEERAVREFLTTVLLDERVPDHERFKAAQELHQFGWISEEEARDLGLEILGPARAAVEPATNGGRMPGPAATPPPPASMPPRSAPVVETARAPERTRTPEAALDPTALLTEMVVASAQLRPDLWQVSMQDRAARLIGLLTSNPEQLAAGGRLDLFSRSLADVAAQCEALSMTPLALHLLRHGAMPMAWKSMLIDALFERAPESALQVHRALRPDPALAGLYLRSLQRRWEADGVAALVEEFFARDLAAGHRTGLWNFTMHELSAQGSADDDARLLALLLVRHAPDADARAQAEALLQAPEEARPREEAASLLMTEAGNGADAPPELLAGERG